jgi:cytochrome c oxidase subunit 2
MNRVLPEKANRPADVVITGHQWWWEVQYPAAHLITANEIHLPVGKTLLLKLLSGDVIHDWWVPELGNKMDMVPNRDNYIWLTINKPGTYYGTCSEFCGAQHAHMMIRVVAQPDQDYQSWLQSNQQAALPAVSRSKGAQVFNSLSCADCHRIQGTPAMGSAGPDLTHVASRQTLLSGMLINNESNLEAWLRDPQKVKPGANMPKFLLSDSTLKALVAYLNSLK